MNKKIIKRFGLLLFFSTSFISTFNKLFANTVEVEFEGGIYTIYNQQGGGDLEFDPSRIESEPWYNSQTNAEFFIKEVLGNIGDFNGPGPANTYTPYLLLNLPSDSNSYSSVSTFSDIANHTSITGAEIFLGKSRGTFWELGPVSDIGNPDAYSLLFDGNHYFMTSYIPLDKWAQPYSAMQNIGLKSINKNNDLVLEKAGKCNKYGWTISDTSYCFYANFDNSISNVNRNNTNGKYNYKIFNSTYNLEKNINDKWKAGISYGDGSSNLDDYNFVNNSASLNSNNKYYSLYGVKKINDQFTLKSIISTSNFDYKSSRNYSSTTSASSMYGSSGYSAEINGIWDFKKFIEKSSTQIFLQPKLGVAYAVHNQDGFNESGERVLLRVDPNKSEALLLKTGIQLNSEISMGGGKWMLAPSIDLNYEMDAFADQDNRGIKAEVVGSSRTSTLISPEKLGRHSASITIGSDFLLAKNFIFNLHTKYALSSGGDEKSYGGGFKFLF